MIQLQSLSFSIADHLLLRDLNWSIKPNRRIGLIGPNGAGKTTFFRLLTGQYEPSSGSISFPKHFSTGYLPQEEVHFEDVPILKMVTDGNIELLKVKKERAELHARMENGENSPEVVKRLGALEDRFTILGGYTIEADAKKVLNGMGFKEEDFGRSIHTFSGGWRMRAHLCRLLIQNPDLLLLDEPTNHLDISSLEWLEDYLQTFPGTIITISHDRFFLDRLVNEIAELERGKITLYSGNYNFYIERKALLHEQLLKTYEAQLAERQRIQKFIDRFRYKASKAVQVQSRVKMLEKMELIELPEESQSIQFKITADTKSYKEVLTIKDMAFSYPEVEVFKALDLNMIRGEKVALVGNNGEGKTTLTRLIHQELKPQKGVVKIGERVNMGYYAQHQVDALNLNNTILDEVASTAAPSFRTKLRDILGVFRFTGDDVNKPVGVLSGGEKARVSLAKILLSPCNFLIMDEPTNHLDIASKDALEQALRDYDGTLLVISHDRYFLDKLVGRVIEIRDGDMFDYPGNYSYFLDKKKALQLEETETLPPSKITQPTSDEKSAAGTKKSKEQKREEAEARKRISKERNQLSKNIEQLEQRLEKLSVEKSTIEEQLADPATYNDAEKSATLNKRYKAVEDEIAEIENTWEEKQLLLEELLESIE